MTADWASWLHRCPSSDTFIMEYMLIRAWQNYDLLVQHDALKAY